MNTPGVINAVRLFHQGWGGSSWYTSDMSWVHEKNGQDDGTPAECREWLRRMRDADPTDQYRRSAYRVIALLPDGQRYEVARVYRSPLSHAHRCFDLPLAEAFARLVNMDPASL
jgi:hypothetical protein